MSAQDEPAPPSREDVVDRARWESLRRAAHHGHLQPEGDRVLQEIHGRHPEWRDEFA